MQLCLRLDCILVKTKFTEIDVSSGGGGTPYSGLVYGDDPTNRGTFFRLEVYKRVGIS